VEQTTPDCLSKEIGTKAERVLCQTESREEKSSRDERERAGLTSVMADMVAWRVSTFLIRTVALAWAVHVSHHECSGRTCFANATTMRC
jgi:hypothetical protein